MSSHPEHLSQRVDPPPTNSVSVDATTNHINTSGYGYDANGNMTNDGYNTLVYDAENRVVSATNGSASGSYTYDGNGLRVEKVSGSTTTVYIFSGSKVIAEYDNGAAPTSPTREYLYAGSQLLANIVGGTSNYFHPDHLSNRLWTDATTGNVNGQRGAYPFGETWYESGSITKWKFTTYERDAESLNDYALARSYVNRLARFSSLDPFGRSIGDPQSLNRYAYTFNDPLNLADPSGLGPFLYAPAFTDPFFSLDYLITGQTITEGGLTEGNFNGAFINSILGQPYWNNPVPVGGHGGGGRVSIGSKIRQFLACAAGAGLILNSLTSGGTNTTSAGGTFGFTYGSGLSGRDWNYNVSLNGDSWGNVSLTQTTSYNPPGNLGTPGYGGPGALGFGYTSGITVSTSKGTVNDLNGTGHSFTAGTGPFNISGSQSSSSGTYGGWGLIRYSGAYDITQTNTVAKTNCLYPAANAILGLLNAISKGAF